MTYTVYTISDRLGDVVYVGCTSRSVSKRFSEHEGSGSVFRVYGKGLAGCTYAPLRSFYAVWKGRPHT